VGQPEGSTWQASCASPGKHEEGNTEQPGVPPDPRQERYIAAIWRGRHPAALSPSQRRRQLPRPCQNGRRLRDCCGSSRCGTFVTPHPPTKTPPTPPHTQPPQPHPPAAPHAPHPPNSGRRKPSHEQPLRGQTGPTHTATTSSSPKPSRTGKTGYRRAGRQAGTEWKDSDTVR